MVLPSSECLFGSGAVRVRHARQDDLVDIRGLMAEHEMYGEFQAEECVVAEIDGQICGFARIEVVEDQPYLRPIVVAVEAHGRGIGSALMQYILPLNQHLIAISRGGAVGFYERLGFAPIEWDQIYLPFVEECNHCPDLTVCQPRPMVCLGNYPKRYPLDNPEG